MEVIVVLINSGVIGSQLLAVFNNMERAMIACDEHKKKNRSMSCRLIRTQIGDVHTTPAAETLY